MGLSYSPGFWGADRTESIIIQITKAGFVVNDE